MGRLVVVEQVAILLQYCLFGLMGIKRGWDGDVPIAYIDDLQTYQPVLRHPESTAAEPISIQQIILVLNRLAQLEGWP
jgi:hypothetical protein